MNSLRSVERAIRSEIIRQAEVLDAGETGITQETRRFHETTGDTTPGREKSDAEDYRYFSGTGILDSIAADPKCGQELPGPCCQRLRACALGGCRRSGGLSDSTCSPW